MEQFKAGKYVKAVSPKGERYSAFLPAHMRTDLAWNDPQLPALLEEARGYLGELNAYAKLVPNIDFFIESYVAREAEQSNRIEGGTTSLEEVYLEEEDFEDVEKVDDQKEVLNYIRAINEAVASMQTPGRPPLSLRLVYEAHRRLLAGVRGGDGQHPGRVRTVQNKIGGSRGSLADAVFIPPTPDVVPGLLSDLEKFWHNTSPEMPTLIKVAYAHSQFETIHPFHDGNGRIGRLIIVLQLMSYGMLQLPVLYLSDYLEKNRGAYYDALTRVHDSHDLEHWVKFFLIGVRDTAKKGRETLESIIDLRKSYEERIEQYLSPRRAALARKLLEPLFKKPVVTAQEVEKLLSVSKPTAHAIVDELVTARILREKTGMKRNRIYTLHEYLALFNR